MPQNILNWIEQMVAHTFGVQPHKIVGRECLRWVDEEVGAGLVDSSEGKHKVFHQGSAPMMVEVERELPREMGVVVVVGVAESMVGEEEVVADIVAVVLLEQGVVVAEEVAGIADL